MSDVPHHAQQGKDSAPVKIALIVEDDAAIAEVLAIFLSDATNYQVIHVFDGCAALQLVRTVLPHLILLDYRLPGMNGLECLDLLRKSREMEQTPVILMSAAPPPSIQTRPDLTFLEKPFELETLLDLIRPYLEQS